MERSKKNPTISPNTNVNVVKLRFSLKLKCEKNKYLERKEMNQIYNNTNLTQLYSLNH